jgi:hypothetical protein
MNVSPLLGADAFPPPAGDTIAATTAYRNLTSAGSQPVKTFIYSTSAALQAGTTVASVTLPTGSGGTSGSSRSGPPERARLAGHEGQQRRHRRSPAAHVTHPSHAP